MQLEITYVDKDKGMKYESYSLPLEATALKGLFRRLSREFGRCVSKVYVGEGSPIGWVFEKKQHCTDKGYFIQETWVTIGV
ncbi:MAG: hypothetical protein IPP10_15615 [Candidatus Competibacteraceae bacterium]|nr:hypothetical protein [Candidatus Competibacteraceae bacterium]